MIWKKKNFKRKKCKNNKRFVASSYNVEILNSFNPDLQLQDTESAIESRLIEILSELRGFKFVRTLVFRI